MGESFGPWKMGNDELLMPHISSANIACGFHAGDPDTISRTIDLAISHDVAIGAHPSFPDLQGFGRRMMNFSPAEIFNLVVYQISAIKGICEAKDAVLHHVKPHGALYNFAASNKKAAATVAEAVRSVDPSLLIYGLSGSFLIDEAKSIGLRTASEVFADRSYQSDGSLTARSSENALISKTNEALARVSQMISEGTVTAVGGATVSLDAETVCIHGDGEHAVEITLAINKGLRDSGIEIKTPS